MFRSHSRNKVAYEQEQCNCRCVMFDSQAQNMPRFSASDRQSGATSEDFTGSTNSLFGSGSQTAKKISISQVKLKKKRKQDRKKEEATTELKKLLSSTSSVAKIPESELVSDPISKVASAEHNLRRSLQVWDKPVVPNPEVRNTLLPREVRIVLNSVSKRTTEAGQYTINCEPRVPYTHPVNSEPKHVGNATYKKPEQAHQPQSINRSIDYQHLQFFKNRQTPHPVRIHLESTPVAVQPQYHPVITPFSHQDPVVGADCENDKSLSNNSAHESSGEPSKLGKPIEAESHYERTVQRNEGDRSSFKGQHSAAKFPMKFKHIVSVPGSDYPDFCQQDSIVIDHFTPVPNPYLANRFSEPPQLPKEEAEYLRTLVGGDVSPFQLDKKNQQSAPKTQRPTVVHDE